jgi:Tol biopolymer transport system component
MIGTSIGPFTIVDQLGAGGMGEVYRATDAKLKRQVALKILPAGFASDPDRLARFEREAHVLASLNHPNIAAIYGLEDGSGTRALVMELIEGPTLAELIATRTGSRNGGALPPDEAWAIARQVADALEAAHALGVVHRDLKPANIKVRDDGTVKVLDFGLAKAFDVMGAGSDARDGANLPTMTSPTVLSGANMILGTAAYMAPEQARGRPVDRRADIWAFGVVFYEMLTGRMAFPGDTVTDVLAAVLTKDLNLADVPSRFRPLIDRCLQKDPTRRLRDIGDMHLLVDDVQTPGLATPRWTWLPWAIAGALAICSAVLTWLYVRSPLPDTPRAVQFEVGRAERNIQNGRAALSPDGTMLVYYAAAPDGRYRLVLRQLDSLEERALPGTETNMAGQSPFWSHDSRYIAFWSGSTSLMKLRVPDGSREEIASSGTRVVSGTWNGDGVIVLGLGGSGLRRVQAEGGPMSDLTMLDRRRGDRTDLNPDFLSDGRHVLFSRRSASAERDGLWVTAIDAPDTATKLTDGTAGAFAGVLPHLGPTIVFLRNGALMVQGIDLSRRALVGDARTLMPLPEGGFSVSRNGVLAFGESTAQRIGQLAWFDRKGVQLSTIGPERRYQSVDLSPGGDRIALSFGAEGGNKLWSRDVVRGTEVLVADGRAAGGIWSPDASRLLFFSYRDGPASLFERPSNGTGTDRLVLKQDLDIFINDWSRDGRFVVYSTLAGNPISMDLFTVGMRDDPKRAVPYLAEPFHQKQAQFSPDGRLVAYISDESGRFEVYVRTFPDAAGGKWPISAEGGVEPRWSHDGKELFYWFGRKLMAVAIDTSAGFSAGVPRELFEAPIQANYTNDGHRWQVSPDGKRLLLITTPELEPTPVRVVLNWPALISAGDAAR